MKAITYDRYGPPDVVHLSEVARPTVTDTSVLVRVHASSVTTADWRIRAAAFPGVFWLPGRLMFGLFRPKNRILGGEFSGEVAEVGRAVTRFRPGDRVFGFVGHGANAEYVAIDETAAIAPVPGDLGHDKAAALPFGGLAALVFLRDFAKVRPGQSVLVIGASGGVGAYAVQIARALGATVTGVASGANADLVRDLGAETVMDYRQDDATAGPARYDVVFDTVGAVRYRQARRVLRKGGVFVPLNFGLSDIISALWAKITGAPRVAFGVNGDSAADLGVLSDMIAAGNLRPVIDRRYPLDRAAEAHAYVEARHRKGAVVLTVVPPLRAVERVRDAG
jgi:NADPH:quinone reductase-like Zn-dependent oxidoreductase